MTISELFKIIQFEFKLSFKKDYLVSLHSIPLIFNSKGDLVTVSYFEKFDNECKDLVSYLENSKEKLRERRRKEILRFFKKLKRFKWVRHIAEHPCDKFEILVPRNFIKDYHKRSHEARFLRNLLKILKRVDLLEDLPLVSYKNYSSDENTKIIIEVISEIPNPI